MMNTYEYGLWPLVIINTAVFIIFAFSFFKPKTGIEWGAFGGFSAFLIALFTEMYGIPLTLFFLAPWLEKTFPGINPFAHNTGMLWHTIFRIPGNPHFDIFHILSSVFLIAGFVLIYQGWRKLYEAHKKHTLATTGIYQYLRHPQYVGFMLIMIGFLLMWPTILTILMFPVLVFMYIRLAKKEEKIVGKEFGEVYKNYQKKTTRFIPKLSQIQYIFK